MMGGNTRRRTNCGSSLIAGSPGTSASTTPVSTKRMAGGTFSRFAAIPTAATTTSSKTRVSIVRVIAQVLKLLGNSTNVVFETVERHLSILADLDEIAIRITHIATPFPTV